MIADPKRADFAAYRGVTVLTPNEHEVRQATRIDAADDTEADRAGRRALETTGGEAVLVTRSAKGLTLVRRDQPALHLPTRAREVADVSGAGDTLVAALAVALGAGAALPEAAMLANITAGISVGKQGTATVSREELLGVLHLEDLVATDRKIATREEAAQRVAAWRAQGLRVGFANGCFDLIHPGHVRLLTEARARCDRLIVALNTDASVQRLKGPTRPLQNETARATVMASLAPVDLVVLFDEDTPLELIQALRPDVLVKGADYTHRSGGGRRPGAGLGRDRAAGRAAAGPQHDGHDPADDRSARRSRSHQRPVHTTNPKIASTIASGSSARIEWLLRSNTRRSEPGISRWISSENSAGQIQSCRPARISVGAVIRPVRPADRSAAGNRPARTRGSAARANRSPAPARSPAAAS